MVNIISIWRTCDHLVYFNTFTKLNPVCDFVAVIVARVKLLNYSSSLYSGVLAVTVLWFTVYEVSLLSVGQL